MNICVCVCVHITYMNISKPVYTLVRCEKTQQLSLAREFKHVIQTKVFFQRKTAYFL